MIRWWRAMPLGGAGYGATLGLAAWAQRNFLYFPDASRPRPDPAVLDGVREITLRTDDALELLAWYRPARAKGKRTLVYFHGNAGHIGMRLPKAAPYAERGYGLLLTTWRGFSGNPGRPSEAGLYADGRAALGFLARQGIGAADLILYGESLGTGVAVQLATESRPAALVLEAPFTSIADLAAARLPFAPVRTLMVDRYDSLAKIGGLRAPLLIVHGERDGTVPFRFGRDLFAAAPEPKESAFLKHAGHNDLYDHGMAGIVLDFLTRHQVA
jgi:hypothetical protein